MFDIEYYDEDGRCPIVEFILQQSPKEQAKIMREIEMLQEFGLALGMPYIRKIRGKDNLWELRIKHGTNYFRIFYCCFSNKKLVLLHGFKKKQGKTPKQELEVAEKRKKKYQS